MFTQIIKKNIKNLCTLASVATLSLGLANTGNATIVEIKTSLSDESIEVNLFDTTTPETVKNFLNYLNEGHYTNSVIHRAVPDFIVQGGGFEFTGEWPLIALVPTAPVINEPVYSNVKGTIAMAKKGNDVNSATNQWFFNLEDNSDNLDKQNGGFTVFGQVIEGLDIIEKVALLKLCNSGGLEGIPMVMETSQTCVDMSAPGVDNFVVIEHVTIIDSSDVTDSDLNPALTKFPDTDNDGVIDENDAFPLDPLETIDTDLDGVGNNTDDDDDGDGVKDIDDAFPSDPNKTVPDVEDSGGSIAWFTIALLGLLTYRKRFFKA